ncbi:hypothetical protein KKF34_18625 [Myxococcota bacterium]|nr:hypothetical protein [Myxococcota bacterium]MBU1383102.1 hypothetical protein [Myxococcota bacterium]MBU1498901.1 hypothetical protein [Myxococcota bacterium]
MKTLAFFISIIFILSSCDDTGSELDTCGDGIVDLSEECDSTNLAGATCQSLGLHQGTLSCNTSCKLDTSECGGSCGDGAIQNLFEECDGDLMPVHSCSDLEDSHYTGGMLSCGSDCMLDKTACLRENCGNGIIDTGEMCDGTNLGGHSCTDFNFYEGTLGCLPGSCDFDYSECTTSCGDGIVQAPHEECDGLQIGEYTCQTEGFYHGDLLCTDQCTVNTTSCSGFCGDGNVDNAEGEECDTTYQGTDTCESLGYYGGSILCSDSCHADYTECETAGRCGDDIAQAVETCDGTDLKGLTCADFGFSSGNLTCRPDCSDLITSNCSDRIYVQVDAGNDYTCALDSLGQVRCWGLNYIGQLGIGNTSSSLSPATVVQTLSGSFASISCGAATTCSINTAGELWCWGQRLDGSATGATAPEQITSVSGATFESVSCGTSHCCADTATSTYCWGSNTNYELGTGLNDPTQSATPIEVIYSSGLISFSAGNIATCGLSTSGSVACWGSNTLSRGGQLDTDTHVTSPTDIISGATYNAVSISTGFNHSCWVEACGQAYCMGSNADGQLGIGVIDTVSHLSTAVSSGSFYDISSGENFTCAVSVTQEAYCWGKNSSGQLGIGSTTRQEAPYLISTLSGVTQISAGNGHACALTDLGYVYCWGRGSSGQLGNSSPIQRTSPVKIAD